MSDSDLEEYLRDPNNLIVMVKRQAGYVAECMTFDRIRNLMKDSQNIFL